MGAATWIQCGSALQTAIINARDLQVYEESTLESVDIRRSSVHSTIWKFEGRFVEMGEEVASISWAVNILITYNIFDNFWDAGFIYRSFSISSKYATVDSRLIAHSPWPLSVFWLRVYLTVVQALDFRRILFPIFTPAALWWLPEKEIRKASNLGL